MENESDKEKGGTSIPNKERTLGLSAFSAKGGLPSWTGSFYLHILIIMLLALFTYSNTFNVPFLFDDLRFIPENPLIKDFGYFTDPERAEHLILEEDVIQYFRTRQVGFLSFWANNRLGGLDVRGYHAANLLIHIINSTLVYLIVRLAFRTPFLKPESEDERMGESANNVLSPFHSSFVALFSGLLFVAHPMQTEAVTYVLQRLVLLAAMFYLAATAAFIGARLILEQQSNRTTEQQSRFSFTALLLYCSAVLFAVLGMKSKENVFTLPLAISLCEVLFFRSSTKKRAARLVPFLLTMLIIPLAYIGLSVEDGRIGAAMDSATRLEQHISRGDYLCTQFSVVAKYIRFLLFPVGQNLDHDPAIYHSFFEPPVFLSFLFLLGIFGLGVFLFYRSRVTYNSSEFGVRSSEGYSPHIMRHALRVPAFGIFWFFLAISVESSVLPIGEMMVEYRVYLPSVGVFLALGMGAFLLIERLKNKAAQTATISLLVIMPFVLSAAAYARNTVWKSEISLWEDVVKKSPYKARGHNNLGKAYKAEGEIDRALKHYKTALVLKPDYAEAFNNLGIVYNDKGLIDKAMEYYQTALRLRPDYAEAFNNLGVVYNDKGLIDRAMEYYQTALRLRPDLAMVHINLGRAYGTKGLFDKAIEHLQIALRLNPDFADAYNNLGNVYFDKGLTDKAIEHYRIALRLKPDFAEAYNNLGCAYGTKGLFDKAIEHLQVALRLKPDYAEAHNKLGVVYYDKGLIDRAIEHLQVALRLRPDYAEAHNNLGDTYASKGLIDKAIEHYKNALRLKPDFAEAYNNLGCAYGIKGLPDKAIEHYKNALRLKPDFAMTHYNLGTAYGSKGLNDKAIEHFQSALRLKPDYADAHFNLGLFYFKNGIMDKARREFEAVLQINPSDREAKDFLDRISASKL